jgi:hypothetical protein
VAWCLSSGGSEVQGRAVRAYEATLTMKQAKATPELRALKQRLARLEKRLKNVVAPASQE